MKRHRIVSLAVIAAAPACALAQSQVNIGGILDVGVRLDSGSTTGRIKSESGSGFTAGSRLTFSGKEDLGSGLAAGFVLEAGLGLDDGTGQSNPPGTAAGPLTFGRTSAVALGSDSTGFISLGRQYNPIWALSAGPANDPFGGSWYGGANLYYGLTPSGPNAGSNPVSAVRSSNSIVYSYGYTYQTMLLPAPRTGLGVAVVYSFPEAPAGTPSGSGEQMGFNVTYGTPLFWVGYAYHQIKGNSSQITTGATSIDTPKRKWQTLAGQFQFGPIQLYAGYNTGRDDAAVPAVGLCTACLNRNNWDVALQWDVTGDRKNLVKVMYGNASDRTNINASYKGLQLGYQYYLSKRTSLYAAAAQISNNANSNKSLGAPAAVTFANGSKPKSVTGGLRIDF